MKFWTTRNRRRQAQRSSPWQMLLERLEDRTLMTAPALANPIVDQSAHVGTAFEFTVPTASPTKLLTGTFTDADDDPLTLSASGFPSWLTFLPTTNKFFGTPSATDVGLTDITVTATAADGTVADMFRITIQPNAEPNFTIAADPAAANEDVSPQPVTVANFATSISAGANESGQTVAFDRLSVTNSGLFSTQPAISPTGTLTYSPAADANGTSLVTFQLLDNGGTTSGGDATSISHTFKITVNAVNDAPSISLNTTAAELTVNEDAGLKTTAAAFATVTSLGATNESTQTITKYTVTSVATTGGLTFLTAPSIDPVTRLLTYQAAANSSGTATFSVTATDDGGTANSGSDTSAAQTFIITVNAVNDAPTILAPAAQTTLEDTAKVISGLLFADVDVGIANVTVVLSATNGTLTLSDNVTNGLVTGQIATNGTLSVTITAPLAAINTTLANASGLTYTPTANFNGSDSLAISVNDGVNPSQLVTVPITVTTVNDAPSITLNTAATELTVNEDAGLKTTAAAFVTVTSLGATNESTQTITKYTVTSVATTGGLTFLTAPSIDPVTRLLTYQAAANSSGTATFSVTATDDGGTANSGSDTSAAQTFIITVNAVNDAPTILAPAAQTTLEDTAKVISGLLFADVDVVVSNVTVVINGTTVTLPQSSEVTVTFGVAHGTVTLSTNVTNGLTTGQITGNGTNMVSITAPLTAIDTTLANASGLTYTPTLNFSGSDSLAITINDNGNTGSGGAKSVSADVAITITAVNDVPTFTGMDQAVSVNVGPKSVPVADWATISQGGGSDEATQTLTFTVTTNNDALFAVKPTISSTGTLTYTPKRGFGGVATVSVTVKDNGGTANGGVDTSAVQTFRITTFQPNATYEAKGTAQMRAFAVDGVLKVQINGVDYSIYPQTFMEKLTIIGGSGADQIDLSGLSETLYPMLKTVVIKGGSGNDRIIGSFADDFIDAAAGNDTVSGGLGDDKIQGGAGTDLLIESGDVDFVLTNTTLDGGLGTDSLLTIENVSLTGGEGDNTIDASEFTKGAVTLIGGLGNDTLSGGTSNDAISGQDGDDELSGGKGNDTLLGGFGSDALNGDAGNDLLIGGFDDDTLNGGDGRDTAVGGQGATARGGNGVADDGDAMIMNSEVINEAFKKLFAFE